MKNKIIIHVEDVSQEDALLFVSHVVWAGRISGTVGREQYCYISSRDQPDGHSLLVYAQLRKSWTDVFHVRKERQLIPE